MGLADNEKARNSRDHTALSDQKYPLTMKPTATLKLSTRLNIGFSLIIALGVLIALLATAKMRGLAQDLDVMANQRMVQMRLFVQLKDNLNTSALNLRNIMLNADTERHRTFKAVIDKLAAENQRLLSELTAHIDNEKGKDLLRAIKESGEGYEVAAGKALQLALQLDAAGADKALFAGREKRLAMFRAVDESIQLQFDSASTMSQDGARTATANAWLVSGLALAMTLLGAIVTWRIAAYLSSALGAEPVQLSSAAKRLAAGDLSTPIELRSGDRTSSMAALKEAQQSLIDIVSRVRANSESVATASAEIAQGNSDLSQRTEEQASALQQTAATRDELGVTVRNNADNAREANQLAVGASEIAARGGAVVAEVVHTMQGISESSRKIGDIISVIDGIAFQTNILALNAAVEAARAGEQGRGFAVVAGEVRGLAQRTAEAAKEVKSLIGASSERVELGTGLVDRAGQTMEEVVKAISRVTHIVGEISSASGEQSSGVSQVGDAISQMDHVTQQNAALVEQSAAAADSLKGQAEQLVQAVSVFRLAA